MPLEPIIDCPSCGLALSQATPLETQAWQLLELIASTDGIAQCYDRWCHDDDWTYCIFCNEGDFDPHKKAGWEHTPDCVIVKIKALLKARNPQENATPADSPS